MINSAKQAVQPGNPATVEALRKRYKNAYRVARTQDVIGRIIKSIGILLLVIGGLMILLSFLAGLESSAPTPALAEAWLPLAIQWMRGLAMMPISAGLLLFISGVLVSAQGQILKANLDSAVNSSPFLADGEKALIMSLPYYNEESPSQV
jgi:hypothetical protein